MAKYVIERDVPGVGQMSGLVLTAECGFFAAAQLRRSLIENAVPEFGAGPGRRVIPAPAPTPGERGKFLPGPGLAPGLAPRPSGTRGTHAGSAVGAGMLWWGV
jgi:hypothetical protein